MKSQTGSILIEGTDIETMNALYNHAVKQKTQLQNDLVKFESDLLNSPVSLQGSISATLVSFERTIKQLDDYLKRTSNDNKDSEDSNYAKFQARLVGLQNDHKEYQDKFKQLKTEYNINRSKTQEANNRNQLFGAQGTTGSSENPFDDDNLLNKRNITSSHNNNTSNLDHSSLPTYHEGLHNEASVFARGNAQLDLILEMGSNSLQDIMDQNAILNKIEDRMTKSLRTLNVSQTTIDEINKRLFKDKLIFWIGLLLLFLAMYYVLKLFR